MPIDDFLKQLGLHLGQIGAQGGQALGNAMQAQGNPAAFQAQQQQSLQHQQLLQQLQLHNSISPYEQGMLDIRKQEYGNQLQWHEDEVKSQAQAKRDQEHATVLSNVAAGAWQASDEKDPNAIPYAGGFWKPKPTQKLRIPTELQPFFPEGQTDFELTKENQPLAEKLFGTAETVRAKAANKDVLSQMIGQGHKDIDARFDGYKGPDGDRLRTAAHNRLNIAQQEDAQKGSTTQVQRELDGLQKLTPWEQDSQKRDETAAKTADRIKEQGTKDDLNSFWKTNSLVENTAKPIDSKLENYHSVKDLLGQHTAAGDGQAAIGLIKFINGGQNSGVRITNAEIQSVFGSMSKWDQFSANISKWMGDTNKVHLISDTYRKQLEALVDKIGGKFQQKQDAIQRARAALGPNTNMADHRKIWNDLNTDLQNVDGGSTPSLQDILSGKVKPNGK